MFIKASWGGVNNEKKTNKTKEHWFSNENTSQTTLGIGIYI